MLEDKVKFFKALGDETRLTVLSYLLEHSYCACDFAPLTEKDQTTVSKHLKVLLEAGILKHEKRGRNIIYSIRDEETRELLLVLGIGEVKPCCSGPESCRDYLKDPKIKDSKIKDSKIKDSKIKDSKIKGLKSD
ncbi:winged helix-turn-helix transcriptional regulator [Methanosarcina sp. KYL-1]|uniref:ArsR/SmtB family transcription factor n=1 Tax=Methanosarcina sp. KYL-1 TaxID=2602068 RepID=UPI002100CF6F|nr:metalloregulator ArsR/SmtB family transcription factor [Methanosarcina sp. KYL-1]MCQ1535177.1 winged helix-turn-helix transcriptional regulator [Methanosarcina sp. KYL-1]